MPRLVLEFYRASFCLKEFLSFAIQYKDRRYFQELPAKQNFVFYSGAVCVPGCSSFKLKL